MNGFSLFWADLKSMITERKALTQFIGIMLIPVIYCGLFLYAFWDPYGQTDNLPVAVVNEDHGAQLAGAQIHAGQDIVNRLKKNKGFDWHFTTKKDAEKGLSDNKYYMVVTIPSNFSKNAVTFGNKQVKKAPLIYKVNRDNNFIASKMGESGVKDLKSNVSTTLSKTYAQAMYDQLTKLTSGMKNASNGAGSLHNGDKKELNGLISLQNHFGTLLAGVSSLSDGSSKLSNGAASLHSGLSQLKSGTDALYEQTTSQTAAINQLNEGANNLSQKLALLNSNAAKLDESHKQLTDGSVAMSHQLDQNMAQLQDTLNTFNNITVQLEKIKPALSQFTQSVANYQNVSDQLHHLSSQFTQTDALYKQNVQDYLKAHPEAANDPNFQNIMTAGNQMQSLSGSLQKLNNQFGDPAALKQDALTLSQQISQIQSYNTNAIANLKKLQSAEQSLAVGMQTFQSNLDTLSKSTKGFQNGSAQLAQGTNQLNTNWTALVNGIKQLSNGENQLLAGSSSLNSHLKDLSSGASSLQSGANQLSQGIGQLKNGQSSLTDGSGKLADKLNQAHSQLADTPKDNAHSNMLANPVRLVDATQAKVDNYGTGFAPYFLSLGLFVGALMLTVIYDMRKTVLQPYSGFSLGLGKFMLMSTIGVLQALIVDTLVIAGLGLHVSNVAVFVLFSILTSLTFMALIQLLASTLGNPGRFIAIIILILQLTTSGGTYPIQLIPKTLQWMQRFLPMTYSIDGFKNIIAGNQGTMLLNNTIALFIFLIIFMAATMVFYMSHFRNYREKQHAA